MARLSEKEFALLKLPSSVNTNKVVAAKGNASKPKQKHPRKPKPDLERKVEVGLKALGFPEYKREYRFFPSRKWRLDFFWPEYNIALEVDGGTYTHGKVIGGEVKRSGHLTPTGYYRDCTKTNAAISVGISVLRADSKMVSTGEIYDQLAAALKFRGWC